LTLRVEKKGSIYELSGTDDRCGAAQAAAVSGTAHVNPNGAASLGLTVIRPDGIPIAGHAGISLVTLSGTWSDQYGNSGTFTYNPAGSSGSPRQVTLRGSFGIVTNAQAANNADTSMISFGLQLASPPTAQYIANAGAATADCFGTVSAPEAAPGHLCVYESIRSNVGFAGVFNSVGSPGSDRTGAIVVGRSVAAGEYYVTGKWALTIP
jgi:hypothetical protein